MPSKEEKQHRKKVKQQVKTEANAALLIGLPISLLQLKDLFDYLDEKFSKTGCDDTLRLTEQFASATQVSFEPLKRWLGEQGGYCDCEVLANVEEKFEDIE